MKADAAARNLDLVSKPELAGELGALEQRVAAFEGQQAELLALCAEIMPDAAPTTHPEALGLVRQLALMVNQLRAALEQQTQRIGRMHAFIKEEL
jgi:hypothetical protein